MRKLFHITWDFPGGPVAKTLYSQCRGPESTPGQGTKSHMLQLRPAAARQIYFFKKPDECYNNRGFRWLENDNTNSNIWHASSTHCPKLSACKCHAVLFYPENTPVRWALLQGRKLTEKTLLSCQEGMALRWAQASGLSGYMTWHTMLRVCSATQSCLTLCNPMDCNPPGSSVHGIL